MHARDKRIVPVPVCASRSRDERASGILTRERQPSLVAHVLNTCLYLGFRADLADLEEVETR